MKKINKRQNFRFIIFKRQKDKYFTGVCLDLDIIEQEKDPIKLRKSLEEAAQGYLEAIMKNDININQVAKSAPRKYWKILDNLERYFHLLRQRANVKSLPVNDSQIFARNAADLIHV